MLLATEESAIYFSTGVAAVISAVGIAVSKWLADHADARQDAANAITTATRHATVDAEIRSLKEKQQGLDGVSQIVAGLQANQASFTRELHEFRSEIRDAIQQLFGLVRAPGTIQTIAELSVKQANVIKRVEMIEDNLRRCSSCREVYREHEQND